MNKKLLAGLCTGICLLSIPAMAANMPAKPSVNAVYVDGTQVKFTAYNINNNNYFKLRDIAAAVSGSAKQFEVEWDAEHQSIGLISGKPYSTVGGELAVTNSSTQATATSSTVTVTKDGAVANLTGYQIKNNNYYKLRDVASAFDIGIDYNSTTNRIDITTTKGYVTEGTTTTEPTNPTTTDQPAPVITGATKTLTQAFYISEPGKIDITPGRFQIEIYKAQRTSWTELPFVKLEYKVAEGITDADGTISISWEVPAEDFEKLWVSSDVYYAVFPAQTVDGVSYKSDGVFLKNFSSQMGKMNMNAIQMD